jgi:8-oxo-dGTP pyrophosphatase MutT (NUDIX family)
MLVQEVVDSMPWTEDFSITHEYPRRIDLVDSSNGDDTSKACNDAFAKLVEICKEKDLFTLRGSIFELFAIVGVPYPVRIYRFAAPLFGIVSQGAHLTAYSKTSSGMKIWIPRRSAKIKTYPNKLDSTVAGGVSAEYTPYETIVKESQEEASLSGDLVRANMRSVGLLSYISVLESGVGEVSGLVKPDMVHVYDLELSEDVVPKPQDDEVKEFYSMTPEEVKAALLQKEFKTRP